MLPEKLSGVRTEFWDMKILWNCERHYVAIPNMEVWQRLARLAPDVPDGWSFPDVQICNFNSADSSSILQFQFSDPSSTLQFQFYSFNFYSPVSTLQFQSYSFNFFSPVSTLQFQFCSFTFQFQLQFCSFNIISFKLYQPCN